MEILEGLLFINNNDAYKSYGVFLSEEKPGKSDNYSALMKPSRAKKHTAVDFRELDGEKYPDVLTPAFEARDVELRFSMIAANKTSFIESYSEFVQMLKTGIDGWLVFYLPELDKTYRMFYKECGSWDQLTDFNGQVVASFKVKFREPNPVF